MQSLAIKINSQRRLFLKQLRDAIEDKLRFKIYRILELEGIARIKFSDRNVGIQLGIKLDLV